jgi:hypothetical protein
MPNMPQSWAALLKAAESDPRVPEILKDQPAFAVFFSLVYPHRFGVDLLRLIEGAL